jgi:hypothetical protein
VSDKADGSAVDHPQDEKGQSRRAFLAGSVTAGVVAGIVGGDAAAGAEPAKGGAVVNPRLFSFVGGKLGDWSVVAVKAVVGDALPTVERLDIVQGAVVALPDGAKWVLRGVTSNERYATRAEKEQLVKKQAALGRPGSTHAALIPIRKSAKWWALTQDERRAIFEDSSRHIRIGLKYLPAVARRLHHCRDLAEKEPFDFLTLFDYAKADAKAFDDLVAALRAAEEWKFVEREVDIRLLRVKA